MIKDIPGLIKKVTKELRDFTDIAIVGLSGGADSTLVAILSVLALGKENVYGVHMPYADVDFDKFNKNSLEFSNHLGIPSSFINIKSAVDSLVDTTETMIGSISTLNHGNMRSRVRMVTLYTICCNVSEQTGKRARVIGTDQLSEQILGYFTKHGDGGCDLFPIGNLVKSEVYQLLDYFKDQDVITEDMIDRVPSAGLWSGQKDEDELGYTYDEMEPHILNTYYCESNLNDPVGKFVYDRYKANKHKHETPPVIALREFCD